MEPDNCTTAAEASVDDAAHSVLLDDLLGRAGSCFARRETRLTCRDMVCGLLMELDDHNCWTIAEAAGHRGPYRMQHLLSRARCDDQGILDRAADWAAGHLCAAWAVWRRRHQCQAQQAHQRWHAYADALPQP